MRIDRVHAAAFGPFRDEALDLGPGMTVVHGPNESGKSSWHAALLLGLGGMRRARGALRKRDRELADRHRPWDGGSWRVGVVLTLDEGRRIELSYDLDDLVDCRATDVVLGTDVSAEVMVDGAPDGSRFLGLTRTALPATLCIRQADIRGVLADAGELQEALQRAAAAGAADVTAEQALASIERFRRERIGTERANATRPLAVAVRTAHAAEAALADARAAHADHLALVRERDAAVRLAAKAHERLAGVKTVAQAWEVALLVQRVAEARALHGACGDAPPPPVPEDDPLERQVTEALAAHRTRPGGPWVLDGLTSAELEAELAALPAPPLGDTDPHPGVIAARRRWERAVDATAGRADARGPADRADAGRAGAGRRPANPRSAARARTAPTRPVLVGCAAALLVTAVLAGSLGPGWVAALLLLVGLAFGGAALQGRTGTARQGERRGDRVEAGDDPGRTADGHLASTAAPHRVGHPDPAAEAAQTGVEEAAAALLTALRDRGEQPDPADPATAVEAYLAGCAARARQAVAASRRDDLAGQLSARRAAEAGAWEQRRLHDQADALLERAAAATVAAEATGAAGAAVGVGAAAGPGADPEGYSREALADALEAWQEHRTAERVRARAAVRAWERLELLLDGEDLDALESRLARCRAALPPGTLQQVVEHAGAAAGPGAAPAPGAAPGHAAVPFPDASAEVSRAQAEAHAAQRRADELTGRVLDRAGRLPAVAELEEAADRARAEERRLRALDTTLATTHRFLVAAKERVHRDIAPRLQASVAARLPAITAGRYAQVAVDPATLEVRVREADGRWRRAALLSHGTGEQVYLLLRLALAEHLCTSGERAPLLLDDVTVHADAERTVAILELLHAISTEHQVVLFTQEDTVVEWAERRLGGPGDAVLPLKPVAAR